MKRQLLSLLAFLVVLTGTAQTIGEAFYIYRSDGEFNAFLREEVDSIAYSYYDADSLYYDEIISQVVYTADSTYWIPLASIDSVSFVTPETKYSPQVVKLEPLLPYIVDVDGMRLTFSSDIPANMFPRVEDVLVLDNFDHEQFPTGFAGRMSSREGMQITCDSVSFEDIYDEIVCYGYYTAINDSNSIENNRVRFASKRKVEGNVSTSISVGGTLGSRETGIYASVDGRLGLDMRFTFKYRKGEPAYFDISLTPELSCNLEAGAEGTISKIIESEVPLLWLPIPDTPFYFKIMGGPVFEASLSASIVAKTEAKLGYKFGVKYVNEGFRWDGGNTSKWISKPDVTGTISGNIFIGLKIEPGIYSYGDIISATIEKKAGVELDASISENIKSPDMFSYDEFRDDYLDINVKASAAFKAEAKLFRWLKLSARHEILSGKFNIYKFKLVPTFTEPDVYLRYSSENSYAIVCITPDDNLIFPVSIGTGLWDKDSTLLDAQFCESAYSDRESWPIAEYSTTFQHLAFNKDYTVRPLIKLFGGMIVAPQEVKFKGPEVKPVTLDVTDITETTATAYGRIEGHLLLDDTMKFGLAYVETGKAGTVWCDATSIDADGFYKVEFKNLKKNTEYRYFAYLEYGGKRYKGKIELFTTEGDREPYYVWDGANKTATYYYDDKRESRDGRIINEEHRVDGVSSTILTVIFDSSFSRYYPKRFLFCWCRDLKTIRNLKYLNTDSITNMGNMFFACNSLTSLDLSHFNTSNVTSMDGMFSGCSSLTHLNVSNFDTSQVTSIGEMFLSCSSMKVLDLSSFRFNNGVWLSRTFANCSSLKTIYAENWHSGGVYDSYIFIDCPNLVGGKGTKLGVNYYYDEKGNLCSYICRGDYGTSARPDGGKDHPGLFTEK